MKEIKTEFDATLHYGYDDITGLEGLVIESRGGSMNSTNYRNPEYSILLAYVLKKLQNKGVSDLMIYVASSSSSYNQLKDRLIEFEGNSIINLSQLDDFEYFLKSIKKAVKKSGQSPNSKGGNSTKRLLIASKSTDLYKLFSKEFDSIIDNQDEEEVEYTYSKVKKRIKQSKFRRKLLDAYNNTCAVTGSKVIQLLEAAHIQPYNGGHTSVIKNGILLRSDIHDLFDLYVDGKRLLNITKDYIVEIHPSLIDSEYGQFNGKKILLPSKEELYPEL